jgi:hypothetical protein
VSLGLDPTLLRCSPLGFVVPDTTCKKKEKKEKKETETKTKTTVGTIYPVVLLGYGTRTRCMHAPFFSSFQIQSLTYRIPARDAA